MWKTVLRLLIIYAVFLMLEPQKRPALRAQTTSLLVFDDDEQGYRQWIAEHPDGSVINTPKAHGSTPDVLHRATCTTISSPRIQNYTTTDFKKICALNKPEVVAWLDQRSEDWRACGRCKP